jgi:superfamily II DNA helicase RecQ
MPHPACVCGRPSLPDSLRCSLPFAQKQGINKPDVRFVFHHSMPKSLECYFQESGRAGRDGGDATVAVFYAYGDARKARAMVTEGAQRDGAHHSVISNNEEALNAAIAYCENQADCRRSLLLAHFGEMHFDRALCKGTCDNCASGLCFEERDVSALAQAVCDIVHATGDQGVGMSMAVDVFRGANTQAIKNARLDRVPGYGAGKDMKKAEAERLIRHLVVAGIVREEASRADNQWATSVSVLKVWPDKANQLAAGQLKVTLPFPVAPGRAAAADKGGGAGKASTGKKAAPPPVAGGAAAAAKPKGKAAGASRRGGLALGPQAEVRDASGIRGVDDPSQDDDIIVAHTPARRRREGDDEDDDAFVSDVKMAVIKSGFKSKSSSKKAKEAAEAFSPEQMLQDRIVAALDAWAATVVSRNGASMSKYHVCRQDQMRYIAERRPVTSEQLGLVPGWSSGKVEMYGVFVCYIVQREIALQNGEEPPPPPPGFDGTAPSPYVSTQHGRPSAAMEWGVAVPFLAGQGGGAQQGAQHEVLQGLDLGEVFDDEAMEQHPVEEGEPVAAMETGHQAEQQPAEDEYGGWGDWQDMDA